MALATATITAATTSATTGLFAPWGYCHSLVIQQKVTTAAGTNPKFTTIIEDSVDAENWNTLASFAEVTEAKVDIKRVKNSEPFGPYLRAKYTIGGTEPKITATWTVAGN